jgi:hypothetical protein
LSSKLSLARDADHGDKQIVFDQEFGPLKIQGARFQAKGEKVDTGSLEAEVKSGPFKGTKSKLTVNAQGQAGGRRSGVAGASARAV